MEGESVMAGPTPPISLRMSINSSVYSLDSGLEGLPKLVLTISSHFNHPITVFTYSTPLDELHAWQDQHTFHQNFTVTDIATNQRVWMCGSTNCRRRMRRCLGHDDERYYLTLLPEIPIIVSFPVEGLQDWHDGIGYETIYRRDGDFKGETFERYFEPGKKYSIGLAPRPLPYVEGRPWERGPDQMILWWRYGTKEEVLEPRGTPLHKATLGWSENKIRLKDIPDVELTVEI